LNVKIIAVKALRLITPLLFFASWALAIPSSSVLPPQLSTISVLPVLLQLSTEPVHEEIPDAQGGFFLVWGDSASVSGAHLLGKHFTAQGRLTGSFKEMLLVPQMETLEDWAAFPDGTGGLAIAWVAAGQLSVRRFSEALEPKFQSLVVSRQFPKRPAGIPADGGALDLVWAENQSTSRHVLKAQRIDAQGRTLWTEGGMPFSIGASLETYSRLQSDNAGGFIVAWYDVRDDKGISRFRIQRINAAGQLLWGSLGRTVIAPVLDSHPTPAMEPLGAGRIVVGWTAPEANAMRFFTQAFDLRGLPVQNAPPRAVSALPVNNSETVLYGDERGNVWTAWTDWRNEQNWLVYLKKLPPTGEAVWQRPAMLSVYVENQRFPKIASDGRDGLFGIWIGDRLGKSGLYAQELDEDGDRQWGEYGRLIAEVHHPRPPQLKTLSEAKALAVWSDQLGKDQWTLNAAILDAGPEPH